MAEMKKERIIPRVRGSAFEQGAGWSWEVMLTIGPEKPGNDPIFVGPKAGSPPCMSKDTALNEMRKASVELMKVVCEALELPPPADFIDLKNGTIVSAEEYEKPTSYVAAAP
jgi:hypothetical protein